MIEMRVMIEVRVMGLVLSMYGRALGLPLGLPLGTASGDCLAGL